MDVAAGQAGARAYGRQAEEINGNGLRGILLREITGDSICIHGITLALCSKEDRGHRYGRSLQVNLDNYLQLLITPQIRSF